MSKIEIEHVFKFEEGTGVSGNRVVDCPSWLKYALRGEESPLNAFLSHVSPPSDIKLTITMEVSGKSPS